MLEGRGRLGTGRAWRARVSGRRGGRSTCGRGFARRTRCASRLGTCSVALRGASTQPHARACLVDGALRGVVESVHVRGPVAHGTLSSGVRAITNAAPHTPGTAARSRRSRSPPSTSSVRGVACFHGVWEIQRPPGLTLLLGSEVISGKIDVGILAYKNSVIFLFSHGHICPQIAKSRQGARAGVSTSAGSSSADAYACKALPVCIVVQNATEGMPHLRAPS